MINLSQMHWLEWLVLAIPVLVIGVALVGVVKKRWAFTSSLFWRLACFGLAIFPVCFGVATYYLCKWFGYDNGSPYGFHPDGFSFECFMLATPVYVLLALVFSSFAKGVRFLALALNLCLGVLWYVAATHVRM